jgi:hypothetical protein
LLFEYQPTVEAAAASALLQIFKTSWFLGAVRRTNLI